MNLEASLEIILEKAMGTGSGTIVGMVLELINVVKHLDKEIRDVHLQVQEMPEEIPDMPTSDPVPEPKLSESKDTPTKRANKGTTGKAKKATKRSI
jgi:hypothetical protein